MTQGPLWDLPLVSAFKMKKTLKALLGLVAIITLFSCVQEKVGEEMKISGQFALINESGLTDCFLEFQNGVFSIWKSTDSYPFAEKRIWHCNSSCFVNYTRAAYSIINGVITIGGTSLGKIELADDVLHFDGKTYGAMEGFYSETYSWIIGDSDKISLTYAAESVRFPVHVEHPIPAGVLHATTSASWIGDLRIEDDCLLFNTTTTNEDRSTTITLSYLHANDLSIPVSQTPSTFIHFTEPNKTIGYEASSHNLEFTIENPIASSALAVTCANSWIENLEVKDDMISFNVTENNSGNDRKAFFYCKYEGAPNVMYTLTQKWTAPAISFSPASAEFDYTGGQGSFTFDIQNPRQEFSIDPQCQANWITDITVNGNTISYNVAENNSGAQRSDSILLRYGDLTSIEYPITQRWVATSIVLTSDSAEYEYAGGNGTFSFEIINPRNDIAIETISSVSWISNILTANNTISFAIPVNNSGTLRSGKIILKYGSFAEAEFIIHQDWEAVITLTPALGCFRYNGGFGAFSFLLKNPRPEVATAITTDSDWIVDLSITTQEVVFSVLENPSGLARSGIIVVSHGTLTSAIYTISQEGHPATSIALNKHNLSLLRGCSEQLIATVFPTDSELIWSSSNTAVVTVSSDGIITAIGDGDATVTISSQWGGEIASCSVSVTSVGGGNEEIGEIIWK